MSTGKHRTLPFVVVLCVCAACQISKHTLLRLIVTFAVGMYSRVMCHRIDACVFYFCEWRQRVLMFFEIWKGRELFQATLGDEALCSRGAAAPGGEHTASDKCLFFFFSYRINGLHAARSTLLLFLLSHARGKKTESVCISERVFINVTTPSG